MAPAELGALVGFNLDAALSPAWATIRRHHPELPPIAFALGMPPSGRRTAAWVEAHGDRDVRGDGRAITFTPYGLRGCAEAVLGVLLHEGAHVADALRGGWSGGHGRRFADAASGFGLTVYVSVRTRGEWWRMYEYGTPEEIEFRARRHSFPVRRYETGWNDDLSPVYATVLAELTACLAPWETAIRAVTRGFCPIPESAL